MRTVLPVSLQRQMAGYAMLEILISLIVIAIAMLGATSLHLSSLKMAKTASFRTQAVLLSSEIAERMQANKNGSLAGAYALPKSSTPANAATDCHANPCPPAQLANFDIAQWSSRISSTLPGSSWMIMRTTTGNPTTYMIVVFWQDRRENAKSINQGDVENFSYTATRVIHQ